jgi:hypothetical protein
MDENPGTADEQQRARAERYTRIALIALGVAAVAGAGFLVYRRMRRQSRTEQLQKSLVELLNHLPESVRDAPGEMASRVRNRLPAVKRFRREARRAADAIEQKLAS